MKLRNYIDLKAIISQVIGGIILLGVSAVMLAVWGFLKGQDWSKVVGWLVTSVTFPLWLLLLLSIFLIGALLAALVKPLRSWVAKKLTPGIDATETSGPLADQIREILVGRDWSLVFQPADGRAKSMSFAVGGRITQGANHNENTWRVTTDGLLELVQRDGQVHGRFRYDAKKKRFVSTDDPDTRNIRNQYMEAM